jgi:rubrerythrin
MYEREFRAGVYKGAKMTTKFDSVEEVLDFAIAGEVESHKFYTDLAKSAAGGKNPAMQKVFEDFAKEELGHKAKLETVKRGAITIKPESVRSLKIADYVVDIEPKPDMNYADALIVAMKKEKAAYRLYLDLAVASGDEKLEDIFLSLAQEEAKHKLRFEIEYDDVVLKEV